MTKKDEYSDKDEGYTVYIIGPAIYDKITGVLSHVLEGTTLEVNLVKGHTLKVQGVTRISTERIVYVD